MILIGLLRIAGGRTSSEVVAAVACRGAESALETCRVGEGFTCDT